MSSIVSESETISNQQGTDFHLKIKIAKGMRMGNNPLNPLMNHSLLVYFRFNQLPQIKIFEFYYKGTLTLI